MQLREVPLVLPVLANCVVLLIFVYAFFECLCHLYVTGRYRNKFFEYSRVDVIASTYCTLLSSTLVCAFCVYILPDTYFALTMWAMISNGAALMYLIYIVDYWNLKRTKRI
ncbi:hypothetical protein EJP02_446 [Escherichia phage EJP2]|nr:hypothetical protein EJP02_446 [Escherichia phage EJP2]